MTARLSEVEWLGDRLPVCVGRQQAQQDGLEGLPLQGRTRFHTSPEGFVNVAKEECRHMSVPDLPR